MKKLILLSTILFVSFALNAQDTSCQRRINLRNMQKGKNFSRMISKGSRGSVFVLERDRLSNSFMYSTISALGKQMKTETIMFNKKSYSRENDGAWRLVYRKLINQSYLDSLKLAYVLKEKISSIEDNCQQLADEILDGEKCYVFIIESVRPRSKLLKDTSKGKVPTSDCIKSVTKEWYSKQGLLKKSELKNTVNGEATMVTTYDYDIDIPLIKEPVIKKN